MKGQELLREVATLVISFFRPFGLKDELLEIPKNVKRMGFRAGLMNFGIVIISMFFAFLLKATNSLIESKLILLGIMVFMLYRGQEVIREAYHLFSVTEGQKFELIFDDEIVLRGSQIIGKTSNKVLKYDTSNKLYKVMSNESMLNTIKNYLKNMWQQKIQHSFDVFEIVSIIIMLTVAILTNTSIKQVVFIPLIFIFMLISFFTSAYISLNREAYYKKHRDYNNQQDLIINDLLRVPAIVKNDLDMRIDRLHDSVISSNQNVTKFYKTMNLSRLFLTIMEAFSQYGIIIFYLFGVEWNSINLSTIAEITAVLVIVETAIMQIGRMAETLNNHNQRVTILKKEEKDLSLILDVYHHELSKNSTPKIVDTLDIAPFSIRYLEESENDKPFTLTSNDRIHIHNGEIVILYGPSGSGKSTFMKMLTEQIRLEKSTEIPATSRFLFYDEKLKFGSLSIYEELFCCSPKPNLEKMKAILENLHLWTEINSNCLDVWQWMKEKQFNQSLSNGQKQRLILAKLLYWMDESIDVLVLDECTSGLDDKAESDSADAERILEYIVRYANKGKKRIIIISTHQNIDGFKKKLANNFVFRNLQFLKEEGKNIIREI